MKEEIKKELIRLEKFSYLNYNIDPYKLQGGKHGTKKNV